MESASGLQGTFSGVQGELFLQDLRWDQGTGGSDPSVLETKQRLFERDQSIVAHYSDGVSGRRTVKLG